MCSTSSSYDIIDQLLRERTTDCERCGQMGSMQAKSMIVWRRPSHVKPESLICLKHVNPHAVFSVPGKNPMVEDENVFDCYADTVANVISVDYADVLLEEMNNARMLKKSFDIERSLERLRYHNVCKHEGCLAILETKATIRQHEEHFQHVCQECGAEFNSPEKVLKHILEHHHPGVTKVKFDLKCPTCDEKQEDVYHFLQHLKKHHASIYNEFTLDCMQLYFASESVSERHRECHRVHPRRYQDAPCCAICGCPASRVPVVNGHRIREIHHVMVHAMKKIIDRRGKSLIYSLLVDGDSMVVTTGREHLTTFYGLE